MSRDCVGVMIAKGSSLRLEAKNRQDFFGTPLYLWNLRKLLATGLTVLFDSDDPAMLESAAAEGAHARMRPASLLGHDTPSVPLFAQLLADNGVADGAMVNLQANSPTTSEQVLENCVAIMQHTSCDELLTVFDDHTINGSVWGMSIERANNYGDFYTHAPDVLIKDNAVDVHTIAELEQARLQHQRLKQHGDL